MEFVPNGVLKGRYREVYTNREYRAVCPCGIVGRRCWTYASAVDSWLKLTKQDDQDSMEAQIVALETELHAVTIERDNLLTHNESLERDRKRTEERANRNAEKAFNLQKELNELKGGNND
jgi:septal ring factor EnvC (AmiA/AmiB activator)